MFTVVNVAVAVVAVAVVAVAVVAGVAAAIVVVAFDACPRQLLSICTAAATSPTTTQQQITDHSFVRSFLLKRLETLDLFWFKNFGVFLVSSSSFSLNLLRPKVFGYRCRFLH